MNQSVAICSVFPAMTGPWPLLTIQASAVDAQGSSFLSTSPSVLLGVTILLVSIGSAYHALVNKADPRSTLWWVAVCLLWPLAGAMTYWVLGVNRIRTRARKLSGLQLELNEDVRSAVGQACASPDLPGSGEPGELGELARIAGTVTGRPLLGGNSVQLLCNGEEAYPSMLQAIDDAKESVALCSYIFDNDAYGRRFAVALQNATRRGLRVQVIIDGIGELVGLQRISDNLKRMGIRVERFLPPSLVPPSVLINLRTHRKLLIIDDATAFTGGMNISERHMLNDHGKRNPVRDLHFRIRGPVVSQMNQVFADDWAFLTGEENPVPAANCMPIDGKELCRGITDGPNDDLNKLKWIILGAVNAAHRSVRIMTPYFIPDTDLIAALNTAALRGVQVEILLPETSDFFLPKWAARAHLWQLLPFGVKIYYQPGSFVHTKLIIVDDHYTLIGSANLDPRSLRLNFEFNLEVYGKQCAGTLIEHFDQARGEAKQIDESYLDSQPYISRVLDRVASLFSPYL